MVDIITEKFQAQTIHDVIDPIPERFLPYFQHESYQAARLSVGRPLTLFETYASAHVGNIGAFSAFRQTKTPQRSLETPTFSKHRKKHNSGGSLDTCPQCDSAPNTPVPPKKRQCRSLSIPSTWCKHDLLKPIALRPHLNNNKHIKNRNSPLSLRGSYGNVISPGMGLRSSSEISSPRESPIPRPASVSSGFYDSASSLVQAPWLEISTTFHQQTNLFKFSATRSFSMEGELSSNTVSFPNNANNSCLNISPWRHKIMRSRSQPCVLSDRKCGVKRRRDEERPTIDFRKMKETAYHRRPRSVTMSQPLYIRSSSSSRSLVNLFSDHQSENIFGLKPITGSPLDSSIPMNSIIKSPSTSPTKEEVEEPNISSQSDSGCSDSCDPPEIFTPAVTGDNCYSYHGTGGTEDLFHIDISDEIDLEQIEND